MTNDLSKVREIKRTADVYEVNQLLGSGAWHIHRAGQTDDGQTLYELHRLETAKEGRAAQMHMFIIRMCDPRQGTRSIEVVAATEAEARVTAKQINPGYLITGVQVKKYRVEADHAPR